MEGHRYKSVEELNARLQELTASGRISEMAGAWKQDDPKWRAQELAYDALDADDLETAVRLVNEALEVDPDCIDARRLMVPLLPATLENKLMLMAGSGGSRRVEPRGKLLPGARGSFLGHYLYPALHAGQTAFGRAIDRNGTAEGGHRGV